MSIQAVAAALRAPTKTIGQRLVLIALANYADDSNMCWPKQATLNLDTGMHVKAISRTLHQLESLGLIRRTHRYRNGGTRRSDIYLLTIGNSGLPIMVTEGPDMNHQSMNHQEEEEAQQGKKKEVAGGTTRVRVGGRTVKVVPPWMCK